MNAPPNTVVTWIRSLPGIEGLDRQHFRHIETYRALKTVVPMSIGRPRVVILSRGLRSLVKSNAGTGDLSVALTTFGPAARLWGSGHRNVSIVNNPTPRLIATAAKNTILLGAARLVLLGVS
jgi:hypothetical protein